RMARALAADGWHVAIHYYGSGCEAEALLAQIQADGGQGHLLRADLRDADAVAGMIDAAGRDAPPPSCLINNASLFENDSALNMTQVSWDSHQAVNLRAPVFLARDFARDLDTQNQADGAPGVVINLLDNKMFALNPDFFSYTIAKYGLLGATKVLAMELAPRVRVCGIAPGITLPSTNQSEQGFQTAHALNPLGRGSTLEQLVAALRFILAAPALTGEVITIDGGQSLLGLPRDVAFLADG
nr:SDR family oxidoreductase [Alphaproteobacteria bacterium]